VSDQLHQQALLAAMGGLMKPAVSHGKREVGNIDLYNRPKVSNPEGGTSTVYSMSFIDEDPKSPRFGKEVLVPRADGGRILSEDEAIARYYETGNHMGAFDSPQEANAVADRIHQDYERGKYDMRPAVSHVKGQK
jgi:hypothetical protein